MDYRVTLETVPEQRLLALRDRTRFPELADTIRRLLNGVYDYAGRAGLSGLGSNVVQYFDWGAEFTIEAGVIVPPGMLLAGDAPLSSTPAGRVATTTHWGPYDQLPQAHRAILDWCKEQKLAPTGQNWEVYGDWKMDPAELRTDIFHQLA
jgi:effector-binding domain-containing protein